MTVPSGAEVGGAQDEAGDQRGPARLVAGADAPAGVTVEASGYEPPTWSVRPGKWCSGRPSPERGGASSVSPK